MNYKSIMDGPTACPMDGQTDGLTEGWTKGHTLFVGTEKDRENSPSSPKPKKGVL